MGTYPYPDNITVCGANKLDHAFKLKAASSAGLMLNKKKCAFNQTEISLFGYRVTHSQIRPDSERLRPLLKLPLPQAKTEL